MFIVLLLIVVAAIAYSIGKGLTNRPVGGYRPPTVIEYREPVYVQPTYGVPDAAVDVAMIAAGAAIEASIIANEQPYPPQDMPFGQDNCGFDPNANNQGDYGYQGGDPNGGNFGGNDFGGNDFGGNDSSGGFDNSDGF